VGDVVALASHAQIGWEWPDRRHGAGSGKQRAVRIKLADDAPVSCLLCTVTFHANHAHN
jgi:hypothetical protein